MHIAIIKKYSEFEHNPEVTIKIIGLGVKQK